MEGDAMRRVFTSYAHDDAPWVNEIVFAVRRAGYEVYLDEAVRAGDSFPKSIREEMATSDVALICRSDVADGSGWVKTERDALAAAKIPCVHVSASTDPDDVAPMLAGPLVMRVSGDRARTESLVGRLRSSTVVAPDDPTAVSVVSNALRERRPIVLAWSAKASLHRSLDPLLDVIRAEEISSGRRVLFPLRLDRTALPPLLAPVFAARSEDEIAFALETALIDPRDADLRRTTMARLHARCSDVTKRRVESLRSSGRYLPELSVPRPEIEVELAAFRGGNRPLFYLVGESGVGKTEALLTFAERCMARGDAVLLVDLGAASAEQSTSCDGLERFIADSLAPDASLSDWTSAWKRGAREGAVFHPFVVVLDQFDSVVGAGRSQPHLFAAITDLAERHRDLRFVLASRIETHEFLFRSAAPPRIDIDLFAQSKAFAEGRPPDLPQWVQFLPRFSRAQVEDAVRRRATRSGATVPTDLASGRWDAIVSRPIDLVDFVDTLVVTGGVPDGPFDSRTLRAGRVGDLSEPARALVFDIVGEMHRQGIPRVALDDVRSIVRGQESDRFASLIEELRARELVVDVALPGRPEYVRGVAFAHDRILEYFLEERRHRATRLFARRIARQSALWSTVIAVSLCALQAPMRISTLASYVEQWRRPCPNVANCASFAEFGIRAHDVHIQWVWGMHVATAVLYALFAFALCLLPVGAWLGMARLSDVLLLRGIRRDGGGLAALRGIDLLSVTAIQEQTWVPHAHWLTSTAIAVAFFLTSGLRVPSDDPLRYYGHLCLSLVFAAYVVQAFVRMGSIYAREVSVRPSGERDYLASLLIRGWRVSWGSRVGMATVVGLALAWSIGYYGLWELNYRKDVVLTARAGHQLREILYEVGLSSDTPLARKASAVVDREQRRMETEIREFRDHALSEPASLVLTAGSGSLLAVLLTIGAAFALVLRRATRAGSVVGAAGRSPSTGKEVTPRTPTH
jgi:hypothetical protein